MNDPTTPIVLAVLSALLSTACGETQATSAHTQQQHPTVLEVQPAPTPESHGRNEGGDAAVLLGESLGETQDVANPGTGAPHERLGSADSRDGGLGAGQSAAVHGHGAGIPPGSSPHGLYGTPVAHGASAVVGTMPKPLIARIIHQHQRQLQYCYERGLIQDPSLTGKVVVRFVIGTDGKVRQVSTPGSTLPSPTVTACVRHAFSSFVFPKPQGGGVVVTYPLVFHPSPDAGASPDARPPAKR